MKYDIVTEYEHHKHEIQLALLRFEGPRVEFLLSEFKDGMNNFHVAKEEQEKQLAKMYEDLKNEIHDALKAAKQEGDLHMYGAIAPLVPNRVRHAIYGKLILEAGECLKEKQGQQLRCLKLLVPKNKEKDFEGRLMTMATRKHLNENKTKTKTKHKSFSQLRAEAKARRAKKTTKNKVASKKLPKN